MNQIKYNQALSDEFVCHEVLSYIDTDSVPHKVHILWTKKVSFHTIRAEIKTLFLNNIVFSPGVLNPKSGQWRMPKYT